MWTSVEAAAAWLVLMLAYSPVADRLASRLVRAPPNLAAFRGLQDSKAKLFAGIVFAWTVGGFLEELLLRGFVVRRLDAALSTRLPMPVAAGVSIAAAAVLAAAGHLYQGRRAALIIGQLSVLFGLLYVVRGNDLWSVVLCHGLYDTIAFVRFARKESKYSVL